MKAFTVATLVHKKDTIPLRDGISPATSRTPKYVDVVFQVLTTFEVLTTLITIYSVHARGVGRLSQVPQPDYGRLHSLLDLDEGNTPRGRWYWWGR